MLTDAGGAPPTAQDMEAKSWYVYPAHGFYFVVDEIDGRPVRLVQVTLVPSPISQVILCNRAVAVTVMPPADADSVIGPTV